MPFAIAIFNKPFWEKCSVFTPEKHQKTFPFIKKQNILFHSWVDDQYFSSDSHNISANIPVESLNNRNIRKRRELCLKVQ